MELRELFGNDDHEHRAVLEATGFWGRRAAGCLFVAADSGRLLLALRSRSVQEPGTWATWGGAMDSGETPTQAAKREAFEETQYTGKLKLTPLLVFRADRDGEQVFEYHNFLAEVPSEFEPILDDETEAAQWCKFGEWPAPLHHGLKALLADGPSINAIQQVINHQKTNRSSGKDSLIFPV